MTKMVFIMTKSNRLHWVQAHESRFSCQDQVCRLFDQLIGSRLED